MENIHSETYSLLIDTYIKDLVQREYLLDATLGSSSLLHTIVAVPNFVRALVVKQKAISIKNEQRDLVSHATPIFDGVLIARAVTDVHKTTENPLLEALKDPKIQPYFCSLKVCWSF